MKLRIFRFKYLLFCCRQTFWINFLVTMFWLWPMASHYTTGLVTTPFTLKLVTMAWLAYILHCPCVLSFPPSVAKCCQQLGIKKSWSSSTNTQQYLLNCYAIKNYYGSWVIKFWAKIRAHPPAHTYTHKHISKKKKIVVENKVNLLLRLWIYLSCWTCQLELWITLAT